MASADDDFTSLPLVERLEHKQWKARVSAYTELKDLFRKTIDDNIFSTYESYLKKIATDANAVAQESGLHAIYEFVDKAPNAASTRETIVPALVDKCLGATKATTKQRATDIILLYAEIDTPDPVIEFVMPGLGAKQPKLVTQVVTVLKDLVRTFGVKKVSPKPILKAIPKLFGHTDKNVRAEASALVVELFRWIGAAINTYLADLKPVQVKELEESFTKIPAGKAVPERLIRSEQAAAEEAAEMEVDEDGGGPDEEEPMEDTVDAFDLADPVDITTKLPADFNTLIASKNWKERKEALDAVFEGTKTPRILDKDYSELMGALTKRINDANILLVGLTANCIEAIASGLRNDFGKYKPVVTPTLIEKLKERKPAILEHISNALNAVLATVPLSDIFEDLVVGSKHKNPQVRGETAKILSRRLKEIRDVPSKQETKVLADMMLKTLDDADGNAREASAEGLGTLMKVVGEKAMIPYTDGMDDIKLGKIKEAFSKAVVKAKAAPAKKPPPAPKPVPVKKAAAKPKPAPEPTPVAMDEDDNVPVISPPKRKPPARLAGGSTKKPALSGKPKPAAAPAAPKKAAKLPPSSGPEEVKYRFSAEDAEARVNEFIPEAIWNDLQQAQWKVRLAAIESLYTQLETDSDVEPEIVIRCLSKKPGWKEMNFQVMGKMFGVLELLANSCPKFSKSCAALAIPGLVEKLGDIKLKKNAGECLIAFAEKISLQFVLSLSYPVWKKAKSPKVLSDSLLWVQSVLMEFGIAGLQIRDLIDFLKTALTNTNASVRTSAVSVLGVLRLYIGPEVKSFVQDVTPALMAIIDTEFDKVAQMEPPKPTRAAAEDPPGASGGGDALDALFPRQDISNALGKAAAECGDANWKVRKEGLEKVLGIIEGANKRIKPNLGDFPSVLKARLNDSNKLLQITAVEIAGLLAVAMGKPFEKYVKILTGPVTAVLSDNKANVRAAGVATLDSFKKTCGLESMMAVFGTSLAAESPVLRKDLLTWLAASFQEDSVTFDALPLITPIFSCLQDRNADVRKAAQACLPTIIGLAGYDTVVQKSSDLKGAQRQTIMPFIEAAKGSRGPDAPSAPSKRAAEVKRPESVASNKSDDKPATAPAGSRLKPVAARKKIGLPLPRSGANSAAAAAAPQEPVVAPISTSDLRAKQVRAKKENRWQFDAPRPDICDALRVLCEANMSSEICKLMFSTSQYAEKDRLNALNLLDECIATPELSMSKYSIDYSDMKPRYIANADLILKYLTIRFFDTSTSVLIKCLDITEHLISIMDEEGCHLSEYEAVSFLPFLINKVGDSKEVMRVRVRTIFKSLAPIYPASKLFNYLLESASSSKNAKVRSECLEEVGALIQRNGVSVMLPNKALPAVAVHIGDRDAGVRNAALGAIAQAYILIGDPVFKYVSRLGEKEKGMLEERLKRTKPSPSVLAEKEKAQKEAEEMEVDELPSISQLPRLPRSQIGKPRSGLQPPSQRQVQQYEPEPMEEVDNDYSQRVPDPPRTIQAPSSMRQPRATQQQQAVQQAIQQDRGEYIVDYLISQITSGDPQASVDALKQLDKLLVNKPDLVMADIEPLVNAITLQVRLAYSSIDTQRAFSTRLCKHLVSALVMLFSNRELACAVSQNALNLLLQELAHRLLDQRMLALESGLQLSKALNVAMVKVLENTQRNATFSALLSILGQCSAGLHPGDDPQNKETKYTELVMKCLWKLAKTIQDNLRTGVLNGDELLFEINKFFVITPPTEWKRRAADNVPLGEMPLRTVKTLLLELVNGLGDSIFQHLTLIEDPPRSSVYPYLHHMLEACRKKEQIRQQQQQQQQSPPQQQQQQQQAMVDDPRFAHSRNASQSRPGSVGSGKSNGGMMRGPSMGAYGEEQSEMNSNSPAMPDSPSGQTQQNMNSGSPNALSSQVQAMQVDETSELKPLSDHEKNRLLTQIFQKIGTRDQTKQGIIELYEFQKKYPSAEGKVNAFLSQSGTYFQSYIRRGLSNLAAEDNELRASQPALPAYSTIPNEFQNVQRTVSPPVHVPAGIQDHRLAVDHRMSSDRSNIHGGNQTKKRNSGKKWTVWLK
ncbi:armadillo-type protein [Phycomyces nitens]|nr:armadillo-type protein [Phycomyces nitens]